MKQKRSAVRAGCSVKSLAPAAVVAAALFFATAAPAADRAGGPPGDARAIVLRAAEFMAKAKSFSVEVRDSYDAYQDSGQKIEFSQKRTITIARPDRLRVDVQESSGDTSALLFDGKQVDTLGQVSRVWILTAEEAAASAPKGPAGATY